MEDRLKCQISPLVKYCQNQSKILQLGTDSLCVYDITSVVSKHTPSSFFDYIFPITISVPSSSLIKASAIKRSDSNPESEPSPIGTGETSGHSNFDEDSNPQPLEPSEMMRADRLYVSPTDDKKKTQGPESMHQKAPGIRTRLSTGSIQMNGTMTISAAKEKQELDMIIKEISKSKNRNCRDVEGQNPLLVRFFLFFLFSGTLIGLISFVQTETNNI